MKHKAFDDPITRREATLILDQRRFDADVRAGRIVPHNRPADTPRTAPLLFDQNSVRERALKLAENYDRAAKSLRQDASKLRGRFDPLTRRQVAAFLGRKMTGILIRSGKLIPSGKLDDTQTAAHTFDRSHVIEVIIEQAEESEATAKALAKSAKARVPK